MGPHGSHGRLRGKIGGTAARLIENNGAGLRDLLPPERVQQAVDGEKVCFRDCLFTPVVTLWMFLAQVLSADGSCREAVAKLLAFLATRPAGTPAADRAGADSATGPYCKARKRLPQRLVSRLARETGQQLHASHPAGPLLGGRKIKLADGTTCSMPDTAANQKQWPQPPTQKPGLGFLFTVILRPDGYWIVVSNRQ